MKILASLLLIGVFVMHTGYRWLADGTRFSHAAMFYMLAGLWLVVLSCVLLLFLSQCKRDIWTALAMGAMLISACEGAQMAACRFAVQDIRSIPAGVNLCDYVTGLPVGAVMVSLYLLIICWSVGHAYKRTR